jgi:hypothetical protein
MIIRRAMVGRDVESGKGCEIEIQVGKREGQG